MFEPIKSFEVDHTTLEVGIHERDVKDRIKTWDIRFKKPNGGDYLSPAVIHTLEHFMATYFKNVMKDTVYYLGPMGCQTGFYLLTKEQVTKRTVLLGLLGVHSYINSSEEIPGATVMSCGQADLQDLDGAKEAINEFYKIALSTAELEVYMDLITADYYGGY